MLIFGHGEVKVYNGRMELQRVISREELAKRSDKKLTNDLHTRHHISLSGKFTRKPLPKDKP